MFPPPLPTRSAVLVHLAARPQHAVHDQRRLARRARPLEHDGLVPLAVREPNLQRIQSESEYILCAIPLLQFVDPADT